VPVPRRFDRRPPERDQTRINERIRVPEVRVIGEDGQQIGVMRTEEALRYAQERDLDLVEVAPDARPPVTRILDYSKYKYEQAQKQKAARKHQQQITIREIKFRPKIAQNDYDTKKGHVTRFLKRKDKVKVTIMFRGREVTHPERGQQLLERLAEELKDLAVVEQRPNLDGRNMTMMLGPSKAVLSGAIDEEQPTGEVPVVDGDDNGAVAPDGADAPAQGAASGSSSLEAAVSDSATAEPAAAAATAEPAAAAAPAEPVAGDAAAPDAAPDAAADAGAEPAASDAAAAEANAAAEPAAEDAAAPEPAAEPARRAPREEAVDVESSAAGRRRR
jgi:translation initiation factor IF-3